MQGNSPPLAAATPSARRSISIVIPVHNEASGIAVALRDLLATFRRDLPEMDLLNIVVVDDGSTDGSRAEISNVSDRCCRLLAFDTCHGSGWSRRVGFAQCTGDLIAWIDGDGSYVSADLVTLVRALADADQVIGARTTDHGKLTWLRLLVKGAICRVASRLWGCRIPDINSGLRVFRREALAAFIDDVPDGFSCTTTATLAALNHGHKVVFLPIAYNPRIQGSLSKFRPLRDTLRLLRVVLRQWHQRDAQGGKTKCDAHQADRP